MSGLYALDTNDFKTILDFLRFGFTTAQQEPLHYGHGTDNAWDEMFALVLGCLSLPYDIDPLFLNAQLTPDEKIMLADALEQRIVHRVPVPYLTHEAYFCGDAYYVDERVLIPRSPIAELIRGEFSPWAVLPESPRILDLCTGSGCIAIACCHTFPTAYVDAVDLSPDALEVAEINVQRHDVSEQVQLMLSDCFDSIPLTQYDIIVSNPPYVGLDEMQSLPDEYRYEPVCALETGQDGLEIVERILHSAGPYLSPEGLLIVEVGNSELLLVEKYPHVPFTWLEFEHGGQGVFLLTAEQVKSYFA